MIGGAKLNIVIAGGGKIGIALASQLAKENHDITLIDNDRQLVSSISALLDIMVLYGNSASLITQREAGVASADLFIATASEDELNILSCITAKKLGCQNTVARVRNPEYFAQLYFLRDELGLSMTVNPEWIAAEEIFRLTELPGFLKRDVFAHGRAEIVEIELPENSSLHGIVLSELYSKLKVRVLVCAVRRGDSAVIPSGSFRLESGDKLYLTAAATELASLLWALGKTRRKTKEVMLVGGSRIAQYLALMLIKTGARVRIIENQPERCRKLAETIPKAAIICADGTSQATLTEEHIESMDTVVTLTNIDEENMVVSMYADHIGVKQVITKSNRTEYSSIFSGRGIGSVISPKQLCTQEIIRFVRALQNKSGSSVVAVHRLADGAIDALEFEVTDATNFKSTALKDIPFKPNTLICCIIRIGRVIIPNGSDTLEPGDDVVVLTAAERVVLDLNDIFAEENRP
jgi:trk system potassium uptake protein TrkA